MADEVKSVLGGQVELFDVKTGKITIVKKRGDQPKAAP